LLNPFVSVWHPFCLTSQLLLIPLCLFIFYTIAFHLSCSLLICKWNWWIHLNFPITSIIIDSPLSLHLLHHHIPFPSCPILICKRNWWFHLFISPGVTDGEFLYYDLNSTAAFPSHHTWYSCPCSGAVLVLPHATWSLRSCSRSSEFRPGNTPAQDSGDFAQGRPEFLSVRSWRPRPSTVIYYFYRLCWPKHICCTRRHLRAIPAP
jgi:hypothetical protein